MAATLAHLAVCMALAITHGPRYALVQYQLLELEQWLADCAADGLHHSLHLQACRKQQQALRVQLALLQPRRAAPATPAITLATAPTTTITPREPA